MRIELHLYVMGCHLCIIFAMVSSAGPRLSNPLGLKFQEAEMGQPTTMLGLSSYLTAVSATRQIPGTKLPGIDSAV